MLDSKKISEHIAHSFTKTYEYKYTNQAEDVCKSLNQLCPMKLNQLKECFKMQLTVTNYFPFLIC
jgi:hypothetical protein